MFDAQIFQILGLAYLFVGLGILTSPGFYKKLIDNFSDSPLAVYFGGIAALVVGYFLVTLSSGWSWSWSLFLPVIGWIAIIKGASMLVFPKASILIVKRWGEKWINFGSLIALALGVWFLVLGFRAF